MANQSNTPISSDTIKKYVRIRRVKTVVDTLLKIGVMIIFIFPFYWMVTSAFKTSFEIDQYPPTLWPHEWTMEGFRTVFGYFNLWPYIKNTIIITLSCLAMQIVTMVPAAYAFAKMKFKGKTVLFVMILVGQMIPRQLTFIPIYIMFSKAKMLDTLWPQIIPFGVTAHGIFLLRQNFKQVNDELIESALLDNASQWQIMYNIMIPMAKATFITVIILGFINHWNGYFWPLVMCNIEEVKPIALVISRLKNVDEGVNWGAVMAGNFILTLPTATLFLLFSKQIIKSMAYRGIK